MIKYEKSDSVIEHSISSNEVLCCAETGRVIAVFYNDYDLDAVIEMEQELIMTKHALKNATAMLHGERQSVTKARQETQHTHKNPNGTTTTVILLAGK